MYEGADVSIRLKNRESKNKKKSKNSSYAMFRRTDKLSIVYYLKSFIKYLGICGS